MIRYLFILSLTSFLAVLSPARPHAESPAKPVDGVERIAGGTPPEAQPRPRIPSTLMFSIDELNDIQSRVASVNSDAADSADPDKIENATLYLSTILYYGPEDWTIWVNGKPIGPRDEFKEFEVTEIGPRFVELLVPLSAQGMQPVRLSPNQTFITRSGTVVEGAWNQ